MIEVSALPQPSFLGMSVCHLAECEGVQLDVHRGSTQEHTQHSNPTPSLAMLSPIYLLGEDCRGRVKPLRVPLWLTQTWTSTSWLPP